MRLTTGLEFDTSVFIYVIIVVPVAVVLVCRPCGQSAGSGDGVTGFRGSLAPLGSTAPFFRRCTAAGLLLRREVGSLSPLSGRGGGPCSPGPEWPYRDDFLPSCYGFHTMALVRISSTYSKRGLRRGRVLQAQRHVVSAAAWLLTPCFLGLVLRRGVLLQAQGYYWVFPGPA